MQSNTNMPPTACVASATAEMYSSGRIIPDDVSTCGAKTKSGLVDWDRQRGLSRAYRQPEVREGICPGVFGPSNDRRVYA